MCFPEAATAFPRHLASSPTSLAQPTGGRAPALSADGEGNACQIALAHPAMCTFRRCREMSLCGQIGPSHTSVLLTKLQQSALSLLQTSQPAAGCSPRPRQETLYKASRLAFWLSPGTESCSQRESTFTGPHSIKVSPRNLRGILKRLRGKAERICLQKKALSALLEMLGGKCGQDPRSFRKVTVQGGLPFLLSPCLFLSFCLCFSALSLW